MAMQYRLRHATCKNASTPKQNRGLAEKERNDIYDKFETYKKIRRDRKEWDEAQLANQLFFRIERKRLQITDRNELVQAYEGRPVSFLAECLWRGKKKQDCHCHFGCKSIRILVVVNRLSLHTTLVQ